MLAKKKKLSRKQIKEDKLVASYAKVLEFYEEYQSKILMGLGAIAVIIVVVVLYTSKVVEDNRIATTQLARVMSLYNSGAYTEAIEGRPGTNLMGLTQIVEEYGSTEQGENAKVIIGNSYYFLEDYDMALEYYSDYSGGIDLYEAAALGGMANCYAAKGDIENAAEYYKKAASVSATVPMTAEYLLNSGINYIKIGDNNEAEILLQRIKDEFRNSSVASKVDKYLAEIK
ncbi:tetratricopeptide repeat protein [Bacteroidota bacterium]